MKNSDHPTDEPSDISIERLLADCDEALIRGENPEPLLSRLDQFPENVRAEFQEIYESLLSVRGTLSTTQTSNHFPRRFGKFRLLKILGQGGFGLVFLAEDPDLRRRLALKVPRLHQLVAPNAEERFLREAQMAANLEHPHLVSIYESGQAEGLPYLASAYCEGPTLARWLDERKELLSIRECAVLVEILAQAVSHMHERKIVHRDLKPSNVLMFPRERTPASPKTNGISPNFSDYVPKITDFGLAKPHDLVNDLSRTGIFLGTAAYVSPEQAWGKRESVGPSTDIYSLGVILYELLTGLAPFRGNNELDTLRQAAAAEPIPPRNLRRETPKDLETICLKCLEKQPENRYRSMSELADDLRRFLSGRPIQAKSAGYIDKTNKLIRRQPWLTGLAGLMFVLMIVVAIGSYRFGRSDNSAEGTGLTESQDSNDANEDLVDRNPKASSLNYATKIQSLRQLRNQQKLQELTEVLSTLVPKPGRPDPRSFEWYYLNNVAKTREYMSLPMMSKFISPDDRLFARFDEPKKVKIIETESGITKKVLDGFASDFPEVHFIQESSLLLTLDFSPREKQGGFRGEYKIWNARNDFELIKSKTYEHAYDNDIPNFSVASEADILFVLDRSDNHRLWKIDLATGKEIEVPIQGLKEFVVSNPTGDRILLKRANGMEFWDLESMKLIKSDLGTSRTKAGSFSTDSRLFSIDHKISDTKYKLDIHDSQTFNRIFSLDLPSRAYQTVFDRDSNFFVIRFGDESIHLYTMMNRDFNFETRDPLCLRFIAAERSENVAKDQQDRLAASFAKRVILPADTFLPLPFPKSEAFCSALIPGTDLLAVGYDHEVGDNRESLKLWNVKTRTCTNLPGHPSTVMSVAVSVDGNLVASGGNDHTVRLWNAKTGKEIRILTGHEAPVRAIAFHPDSRRVASGDNKGIIKIWDCVNGKEIASWKANSMQTRALIFMLNGETLVSAGSLNPIQIWRTSDQKLLSTLGENMSTQGLALSPDGSMLASAHQNLNVHLWDLDKEKLITTIRTHTNKVRCVAFSPDGKTLASGGDDNIVRFWNISAGLDTLTIPMEHEVTSLTFDATGKNLTAALRNGFVRVFNGSE